MSDGTISSLFIGEEGIRKEKDIRDANAQEQLSTIKESMLYVVDEEQSTVIPINADTLGGRVPDDFEQISNKIEKITSYSTHKEYPSAKSVYNLLTSRIMIDDGDIKITDNNGNSIIFKTTNYTSNKIECYDSNDNMKWYI